MLPVFALGASLLGLVQHATNADAPPKAGASPTVVEIEEASTQGWFAVVEGEVNLETIAKKVREPSNRRPLKGRITIPSAHRVVLHVQDAKSQPGGEGIDLSLLDQFQPDEIYLLYIQAAQVSAEELKRLTRHKGLRHLTIGPLRHVANEDLVPLKELKWLEQLTLAGPGVRGKELPILKELPALSAAGGARILQFSDSEFTDEDLKQLRGNRQVEILDLSGTKVTDAGLAHLAGLKQLQYLKLSGTVVTGSGLEHLAALDDLQKLSLYMTLLTDEHLPHLKELPALHMLNLGYTRLTGAGFEHLGDLKQLRSLMLDGLTFEDDDLRHLSGLKKLEFLGLNGTKVSDAGLMHLAGLSKLKVGVGLSKVTDGGLERFRAAQQARAGQRGESAREDAPPNPSGGKGDPAVENDPE